MNTVPPRDSGAQGAIGRKVAVAADNIENAAPARRHDMKRIRHCDGRMRARAWRDSRMGQGQVNIICSVQMSWCQAVGAAFTKETGINVGIVQKKLWRGDGRRGTDCGRRKANPKLDVSLHGDGRSASAGGRDGPHRMSTSLRSCRRTPSSGRIKLPNASKKYRTVGVYKRARSDIAYRPRS
jgi:hypothetical protein